jgi:RNA polymerase sigma-70 factor (ECF subfamily)
LLYDDPTTPEDHELLIEARCGDYDAFEQLHDRLYPPVRRFVARLIGQTQEVEDIVQETFIALFTHMHRIDPPENVRPYVFRIARNRAYDTLRRQGRFEELSLDEEPIHMRVSFRADQQNGRTAPDEVTHWLLLHLEVQQAMEELPELQRQALILYSEEDLSYAEIAEVMEVSIGTVKSRLYHAKKNLRGLLSPETLAAINNEF